MRGLLPTAAAAAAAALRPQRRQPVDLVLVDLVLVLAGHVPRAVLSATLGGRLDAAGHILLACPPAVDRDCRICGLTFCLRVSEKLKRDLIFVC